uniref:GGDEF domain-containing protein n=3 Tax=uncultured Bilophila sp. TaxID=529385 RepID=UPI0025CFA1FF|nr:GGDEF domain-containing protein [uncultured Bilophila sp.]
MQYDYRIENEERIGTLGRRGIALTHEVMYRHYRRDEAFVREQMTEDVTWIGPLRAQYTTGVDNVMDILKIEEQVTFSMEGETFQVAYEDETSCLIFGNYTVTSDKETGLFIRTLQRVSFYYRLFGDRLKIVHMHLSHPYEYVEPDEVFPFRYGKEAFDYIQQTHQMAFTDSLTELGNRNAYEMSCVRMAHDVDSVRSLCLILFDINGMKRVNDTRGHLAGDKLLRDFATLLREAMPPDAKLYRYGGDEFIAALHDVSLSDVRRCQRRLERRINLYNEENGIRIGVASGYAFFNPETDHGLSEIVKRADAMLYADKRAMKRAASRDD